ncbi:uncharacterized protein DNG_03566 [Cephalotrichum gorgonifer]|uniref:Uncharacterized protein n=1 Tax=Cephalotrichum gorgonifer TaxID=2041049 RepID=A0AAE8MWZ8_9PEZI|nr:uncharacterized protein DNG_03566 [Cephalotrichum gorgonifer]
MADPEALSPPERPGTAVPGAHDDESSDSEDHFSDAKSAPMTPSPGSPAPTTQVEKVSHESSDDEVSGTEPHVTEAEDAKPYETAAIPDPATSAGSESASPASDSPSFSEAGAVPQTVVSETAGSTGTDSEEFAQGVEEQQSAVATPDVDLQVGDSVEGAERDLDSRLESPISSAGGVEEDTEPQISPSGSVSPTPIMAPPSPQSTGVSALPDSTRDIDIKSEEEEEQGGDDFDDFEEGDGDDDFDDFEDGFQQAESTAPAQQAVPPPTVTPQPTVLLPLPVPDFDGLDSDDINDTLDPYIHTLFPPEIYQTPELPPLPKDQPVFLTARSASLWSQLVAPPPLSPPDWIRSRIRRLFLVSLGVPVDLDEILPASKQKKLVLPSLSLHPGSSTSPRTSTDSRSRSVTRLKQSGENASSTSVDTQGKPSTSKRRKGPSPVPDLDLVSARQLCKTTDEALDGMTDIELKTHAKKLAALEGQAKDALEYWQKRTDEKISDRETFEGVIENLVKHARKVRK